MKYIIFGVLCISLLGCGKLSRIEATLAGYSIECIEGIRYIQFTSGATPKYNREGKIEVCN